MIYTYRCPNCGHEEYSTERGDRLRPGRQGVCHGCGQSDKPFHRVFGFSYREPMQPHFNNAVGRYVSSESDFGDELKRASETASATTGIEHDYKPLEWGDKDAFGATNEGIHESNISRERQGAPLLPDIG